MEVSLINSERCVVCGNDATGIHFSANSICRACAAFFRRSVSYKREYTCVNDPVRCSVNDYYGSPPRHMCKLCRFSRCINGGMRMQHIVDRTIDEFKSLKSESFLRKIMVSQRGTFTSRYAAQLQAYGGNAAMVKMGKDNVVFANKIVISTEFIVLSEYLAGFAELGLSKTEIVQLAKELFHTWLTFRAVTSTLKNTTSNQNDICYFVDDSFVKVEKQALYDYVKSCPGLYDYELSARYAFKCCSDKVAYANRMRDAQMEDLEQSVLFYLFALKKAQQLFGSNQCFKHAIDQIFTELKTHFSSDGDYDEVALKIGNLTLMLGDLGVSSLTHSFKLSDSV
ncbi:Nuclear receptor domain-containing protein [Aphelenchoides bicaudatus]|nr:Nuclear receptor domain-containing protein [Aphelenchoides bicaudatus]